MILKTKQIESTRLTGVGSLEELLNAFLATLDPKDVLDVVPSPFSSGKYGLTTTYVASVLYRG